MTIFNEEIAKLEALKSLVLETPVWYMPSFRLNISVEPEDVAQGQKVWRDAIWLYEDVGYYMGPNNEILESTKQTIILFTDKQLARDFITEKFKDPEINTQWVLPDNIASVTSPLPLFNFLHDQNEIEGITLFIDNSVRLPEQQDLREPTQIYLSKRFIQTLFKEYINYDATGMELSPDWVDEQLASDEVNCAILEHVNIQVPESSTE